MGVIALGVFAGLFAVWYVLLSRRVVPVAAMRVWFLIVNLLTIFPVSGLTLLVDSLRHVGVSMYYTQTVCVVMLCVAFRIVKWSNPQIKMKVTFRDGITGFDQLVHGAALVGNHTSFWDVYVVISVLPLSHLIRTRTLMKSSLREIPIFGGIFDRVGHFPVYFKSDEDGNFHVDKERQAEVQVKVDKHIANGGTLAIFPEGAINKDPTKLQAFRHGTFATIFEYRMPIYYAVMVGNDQTWPRWAPYGGWPADIVMSAGAYPVDFEQQTAKDVAAQLQTHMQSVYDEVAATLPPRRLDTLSASQASKKK